MFDSDLGAFAGQVVERHPQEFGASSKFGRRVFINLVDLYCEANPIADSLSRDNIRLNCCPVMQRNVCYLLFGFQFKQRISFADALAILDHSHNITANNDFIQKANYIHYY